jgi:hypothetical protein
MPLVTRNQATESSKETTTESPATILDLRETPARLISKTWPTISTTQTMPITANVMIQKALGGWGASEGKSGKRLRSQGSSQIFSTVTANRTVVNSQVRLSVSDFRIGGWKLVEVMCSPSRQGTPRL